MSSFVPAGLLSVTQTMKMRGQAGLA